MADSQPAYHALCAHTSLCAPIVSSLHPSEFLSHVNRRVAKCRTTTCCSRLTSTDVLKDYPNLTSPSSIMLSHIFPLSKPASENCPSQHMDAAAVTAPLSPPIVSSSVVLADSHVMRPPRASDMIVANLPSVYSVPITYNDQLLGAPITLSPPKPLENYSITPEAFYANHILPGPTASNTSPGVENILHNFHHHLALKYVQSGTTSQFRYSTRISNTLKNMTSTLHFLQSCINVPIYPLHIIVFGPRGVIKMIEQYVSDVSSCFRLCL